MLLTLRHPVWYHKTVDYQTKGSYYARTKEVTLKQNLKFDTDEITLQPKSEISNFKSFKEIDVKYNIDSYSGEVYKAK